MESPPLHPSLEPVAFLLGAWKGKGEGIYPTIEPFSYLEIATYTHVGKPFIAYSQRTSDAATGAPLHAETGYLRAVDGDRAEMVIVQPSGIMELLDVHIDGTTLTMTSREVVVAPTAKSVTEVTRVVSVHHDSMRYHLDMAAVDQPLQRHLTATLDR